MGLTKKSSRQIEHNLVVIAILLPKFCSLELVVQGLQVL